MGSGSASVTFTAHLTDGSPITGAYVSLVNSAASQQVNGQFERVSGTAEDGVWQATLSVPQGAAAGSWDYTGSVQDAINYLGFGSAAWQNQSLPASAPGALTVTDTGASAPPQIASLGYSPSRVDVGSGSASVTFTAHLTDGSPITGAYVSLVNSAASQQVNGQFERVSGTAEDGVWQATLSVPQGAAAGSWDYTGSVQDAINYLGFGSAAWQNQSLPASAPGALTVTDGPQPPQITSPSDDSYQSSHNVAVSGTAEAGSTVSVLDGSSTVATVAANGSGNWSTTITAVSDGRTPTPRTRPTRPATPAAPRPRCT